MAKIYTTSFNNESPEIDLEKVHEFFLNRANKLSTGIVSYKQAIMYQDKNESLAEARDLAEKELLLPKLKLSKTDRFLDVGCGTGRWAEAVSNLVSFYHGTDLIQGLIDEASKRILSPNVTFSCLPCTSMSMAALNDTCSFNKIICFGVLMYLNDLDIQTVMKNIVSVADNSSLFLLREPVGIDGRLTIKENFSEDMEQYYSAIYRTDDELVSLCSKVLKPAGFELIECEDVFSNAAYNNRTETKQKYFVFERK